MTVSLSSEQIELIARVIHERYRRNHPSVDPWETLPESLKHSNRSQAMAIPEKVASIGCRIGPLNGPSTGFTPAELERLARAEHDRWVRERRDAGWTLAPVKDLARKQSPYLVGWEELSEEVRELDRDAVRGMADALGRAGLGLYRP